MRRQNHSCDQCRKAKRACDAPSLRESVRRSLLADSDKSDALLGRDSNANGASIPETEYRPCSYCLKTSKHCTLNWARSQLLASQSAAATRTVELRQKKRHRAADTQQTQAHTAAAGTSASAPPTSSVAPPTGLPLASIFPSPPQSSTSTLRTTSEIGDISGMPSSVPLTTTTANVDMSAFWSTTQPSPFQALTNPLDPFVPLPNTHHPHHPQQHHNFTNGVDVSTISFDAGVSTDGTAGLIGLPFNGMPATTTELVSRPAFHNMVTPDPTALWGVIPGQTNLNVTTSEAMLDLSPPEVFSSVNGDEEDGASSSVINDSYSIQHGSSFAQPQYGKVGARRVSSYSLVSPTPNQVEFMLATRMNNHSISENLLQIYHDVLEHNLTCWITEETCPYNVWARPPKQKPIRSLTNGSVNGDIPTMAVGGRRTWAPQANYKQQFGPKWSNRIYRRVTKLDKLAQQVGIMRLTAAQNQASQKALHLVIMAFATQWAQGSQRQRETYAGGFATMNYATTEEFDRSIQRSLWQQARIALQDCADIESYRVVCAELIFSMTQRPWDEYEFAELELTTSNAQYGNGPLSADDGDGDDGTNDSGAEARRRREAILDKLNEIIDKDGPPIFIERAARKMHALKFKFDNHELGFLGEQPPGSMPKNDRRNGRYTRDVTDPSSPYLGSEESQTVGLLFWLAVMFDTISASMTERPVVLADEESQHEAAEHDDMFLGKEVRPDGTGGPGGTGPNGDGSNIGMEDIRNAMYSNGSGKGKDGDGTDPANMAASSKPGKKNNRWRIDLFIQDDPERMSHSPYHYPCAYDDAASIITRAAPVKVLLYRQVLYLQNMLRKPYLAKGQPIEELISETLMIYRYWNLTYGAFYRELIEHYPTVPTRIRGWFVCILAHWHLAALMLADVMAVVDDNRLGLEVSRAMREQAHTVATIRRSSALQLADVARVATPLMPNADADPSMPDFHHAVREGTILTEPWTILLIRAFSKAATVHLRAADGVRQQGAADLLGHEGEACRASLRHCEECIQALWYLGKKSDMARNVAAVLFRAMNV
ncbi:hypothetical protein HMPREF1624_05078 [Sporothrix schenckii ATCC 58251]|uniref:Zn(2)-C6 fungal-type domain-containing protein n=1 Tax=Sporothrix schenckii (strain ATCC 58251 / de Perez 2211183) TaxID=1391915 RepID=U7PU59_SPOS1|nr:hypothetical protein HMPREF1624_05078 [Sporothrix schenckii ATCC 58251]